MTTRPGACECGREALIVLLDDEGDPVLCCEVCLDAGIASAIEEEASRVGKP